MEYHIINSFTQTPFEGNPAAVFLVDTLEDDSMMQHIAKQMNLVETVFVQKKDESNTFHIRYFTPDGEVGIAGHPTVAALCALHRLSLIDTQHDIYIITPRGRATAQVDRHGTSQDDAIYYLTIGDIQHSAITLDVQEVADVLSLDEDAIRTDLPISMVDSGLGHLIVPIGSLDQLFKAKRNIHALKELCTQYHAREAQLFTFDSLETENDLHTRNICPREGIEDPACGIGNAALLAYLSRHHKGRIAYRMEQGHINDFKSLIIGDIIDDQTIRIGGHARLMAEGCCTYNIRIIDQNIKGCNCKK